MAFKMVYGLLLFLLISSVTASSVNNDYLEDRLAYDYELYESVLDPELCQRQLRAMNAFEFYDASFRIPHSMLRGNRYGLGNYHQCLAIEQPLEEGSIRGKYCLIQTESLQIPILTGDSWPANVTWLDTRNVANDQHLEAYKVQRDLSALNDGFHSSEENPREATGIVPTRSSFPSGLEGLMRVTVLKLELLFLFHWLANKHVSHMILNDNYYRPTAIDVLNAVSLTLALCIPRSCSVHDVLRPLTDGPFIQFNYTEEFCRLPDDKPYSGADIAALVVFSVIGCLTLISTAYELHHIFIKKKSSKPDELWSCFSVYGNTDRLLTLGSSRRGTLDCLDGIRSLSILWVIFGHTFIVYFLVYPTNIVDFYEWSQQLRSVFLMAANVSVDTFFMLSGLLLVYTTASKMNQMQLMKNLHLFYLNRLLRMFPLLAAAVLLQASVLHQVADGVRWNRVAWETQKCRDYWWSALLHIQNLVNTTQICLSHSWYLSVDVQLYILSPLLLFWVLGSRRSAWSALVAAVLSSLTFITIFFFTMEFSGQHDRHYVMYFYHNTLARSPVFIIGMLCGYVLHISRHKKIKMSPWVVCSGYALAMVMSGYCLYRVHPEWESQVWINLSTALFRSAWAASLSWLIIACVHGYSGPINWFLSLKLWKFVARISYAMYLFHYPLQFVTSGADIMPVYFSMENGFVYFANDVAYTVIVSVAACVLIDAPCSTLIRRMMTGITTKKTSPKPDEEQKTNGTKEQPAKEENEQNEGAK